MRKLWLIFAQAVTIFLSLFIIVAMLKPHWVPFMAFNMNRHSFYNKINSPDAAPLSYSLATQKADPAVVSIYTSQSLKNNESITQAPEQPQNPGFIETSPPLQGLGSGVIIYDDGYILTNSHLVEGSDEIQVALPDNRQSMAKVVGIDSETDLALLKIELDNLPVIPLGNSDTLQVGDIVLAIGNPFGVGQTVTSGIISALGRSGIGTNAFENFIQTDAAINPGNSGGALINTRGELIGINTAIYSRTGGYLGIGFAIPVNSAMHVAESLIKDGKVTRSWIGAEPRELTPDLMKAMNIRSPNGILITAVRKDGPAEQAGLLPGDVIVQIGSVQIINPTQSFGMVSALPPGEEASFIIERSGEKQTLRMTPQERPHFVTQKKPPPEITW